VSSLLSYFATNRLLISTIRDRVPHVDKTAQSLADDLDQVAARLQDVPADKGPSTPRWPTPATTAEFDEEEQYRGDIQFQTDCYNKLVEDGGRPSHPLIRLEDIVKNPGEYREILSFWQGKYGRGDEWEVFGGQWGRWYDFRRLQRFARGQSTYDYWRSEWEHERKANSLLPAIMQVRANTKYAEATEEDWEFQWQRHKEDFGDSRVVEVSGQNRPWEQFVERQGHTPEQQGFPEYVEALKERLARHGFTRTFELDKDPDQQDKLTTWIEYLGYEYWWYDQHADFYKRRQRLHDEAWKKLVDSKVLRPGETVEVIHNIKTSYQHASEEQKAKKAVQSAMSAVSSAEKAISKSQRSRVSPQELQQRLVDAQSMLDAAKEMRESIRTRNNLTTDFIRQTNPYVIAKEDAERHRILLRWMLQQVPLIELESNPPNVARNGSDRRDSSRRLKRNRPEELDEEQRLLDNTIDDRPSKRPKNSGKPLPRRSSRIAEREQRLNFTITTPPTMSTQLPTPPLSTPPKEPSKRSSVRTTKKRGRSKTSGRRHTSKTQAISKTKRRTHS
jgi:hypothetical protein